MNVDDPRALVGTWRFDRIIHDVSSGRDHTASGEATFVPDGDRRVRWSETGTVRWGGDGDDIPIARTLVLDRRAEGWMVLFDDGREFHPWLPGREVEHPCGDDVYTGRVLADQGSDTWSVAWNAAGPTKDYAVTTVFSRSSEASGG